MLENSWQAIQYIEEIASKGPLFFIHDDLNIVDKSIEGIAKE